MKRLIQFGLLLLFMIALQVMVPHKAGPSYAVADYQYVIHQVQPSADLFSLNADPLYLRCPERQGDVEESSYMILTSPRHYDIQLLLSGNRNLANMSVNVKPQTTGKNRTEGTGDSRLNIGDNHPRGRVMPRHT